MAPIYGGMVKILEDWAIRSQAPNEETEGERGKEREDSSFSFLRTLFVSYGEGSTTVRRTGQPEYTV